MPVIIDPSIPAPTPPTTVTGPDGILTAARDDAHAGVLLVAVFAGPAPVRVRFVRIAADGTQVPVRSGATASAPGGTAVAYDQEAPLGVSVTWRAIPVYADGSEGAASAGVALTIPEPEPFADMWLKSASRPDLSMRVTPLTDTFQQVNRALRDELFEIPGSPYPVAAYDVRSGLDSSVQVVTETLTDRQALLDLVQASPVVLAQTRLDYALPDAWLLVRDLAEQRPGTVDDPVRVWTLPVSQVDRPAPEDAPLRIPGRSYADSAVMWPMYADRVATGQTYLQTTTGG